MSTELAYFPDGAPTGLEIKDWVDHCLAAAKERGEPPRWALAREIDTTPAGLRRRRAALLFLLALPGTVSGDANHERDLHEGATSPGYSFDEIMERVRVKIRPLSLRDELIWHPHWVTGAVDAIAFECRAEDGWMTLGNFSSTGCRVTDGTITVASDLPYGDRNLTSDNDDLPPLTTIWLARK